MFLHFHIVTLDSCTILALLTSFSEHLLDINKIILSYLTLLDLQISKVLL